MVRFCGQEACLIDANGRVKLPPRFLTDFRQDDESVVLHCLPEGALGIYPAPVWTQMRQGEARPAAKAATSILFRRQLRRFGALTQSERITNQGRITVPNPFRELLGLEPGQNVILVGTEIGVEIWNAERWQDEFQILREHERRKAELEMTADLETPGRDRSGTT